MIVTVAIMDSTRAAVAMASMAPNITAISGGGHIHHKYNKYNKYNDFWFNFSWYSPACHYETKPDRVKVWDRHGNPYFKWVKRDVKVCY